MPSTSILVSFPCRICLGLRTLHVCQPCGGTGWQGKPAGQLTPAEARRLRGELASIPEDPDTVYERESVRELLSTLLTRFYIQSVSFPEEEPTAIDLTNSRGTTLRIEGASRGGKFHHLTASPLPPAAV